MEIGVEHKIVSFSISTKHITFSLENAKELCLQFSQVGGLSILGNADLRNRLRLVRKTPSYYMVLC